MVVKRRVKVSFDLNPYIDDNGEQRGGQPRAAELFEAAHSGKYRVIVLGGAVRGGKTFGVGGTLVTLHKRFPGSRSICVRDNLPRLRVNTLPSIQKLMPDKFIKKFLGDPQYNWLFTNGGSFQFFPELITTDPSHKRWNGLEVNWIWLEQAEELQKATYEKALERAGSYFIPKEVGEQPEPIIFITVNPTDEWPKAEFYDKWVDGTLPDWIKYIPMLPEDNGELEPSYRAGLERLKETNYARYLQFVKGLWTIREKTGNEWFHGFEWGVHTKSKDEGGVPFLPGLHTDVHASFDFNTVPYMTATLFQLDIGKGKIQVRFFKEYCLESPDNTTIKLCQNIAKDYLIPHKKNVTYHGDRTGENRVEGEGGHGKGQGGFRRFDRVRVALKRFIHARSNQVDKSVVVNTQTRDFLNAVFIAQTPGGEPLPQGMPIIEIFIDEEKCPKLCADLANTKEIASGIKKEIKTDKHGNKYEANGHALSTFTYGVVSAIKPLYQEWKKKSGKLAS